MTYHRLFTILAVTVLGCVPVARAFGPPETSGGDKAQQVSPAALPPLVDVLDADHRWPVHYQVPRADLPSLINRKAIVAEHPGAEEPGYRFASAEAALTWFAAAQPVVPPQGVTKSALQELDLSANDVMTFTTAGQPWSPTKTLRDEFKRKLEESAASKQEFASRFQVLLIDRQKRLWLLPDFGDGLFGFDLQQHSWIERKNLPPDKPPKDRRDKDLVPRIIGPAYQSRSGLLFFGDRMGVHVFDGQAWQFQKLYQRNIDEDRYFDPFDRPRGKPRPPNSYEEIHRFSGPSFSEDSQGRVYVWTSWGHGGEAGTIGFWVYDHGKWKNVDVVEQLYAVIPRDPDEIWLLSHGHQENPTSVHQNSTLSVIKGGRHITGDEAQRMLVPNLRLPNVWARATAADGTVYLLFEDVFDPRSRAKTSFRGVALRRQGPAIDLGDAAGKFLKATWGYPLMVDPQGWVWGGTNDGLTAMSPDGRQINSFPITKRLTYIRLTGFDGPYVYFSGGRASWRFDPEAYRRSPDVEPLLPAATVRIRGSAAEDALGRMWCIWDIPDSPTVVFDGKSWEPRLDPDVRGRPRQYNATFRGADGAMIFVDDQYRFHLFDAAGHVAADSAEELALQYGDRLRKALPYPPPRNSNRDYHLVKDAQERIWWADAHFDLANHKRSEGWGVVDGKKAIRGPMDELKKKVRGGRITVLYPIEDGTRLLLAFQALGGAASGVYGVENDRIVRLADSPVHIAPPSSFPPQTTAWTDSEKRVWIARNGDLPGPGWYRGVSQVVDSQGKPGVTHDGWLVLEDHKKGLWFTEPSTRCIMRLDPDGRDAKLEWPNLTGFISFTKSPDGSVWMLTYAGIFRTRVEGNRLSIVERYPVEVQNDDCLWCDREGRVWMAHTHAPKTGHGEVYRELIRFATKP